MSQRLEHFSPHRDDKRRNASIENLEPNHDSVKQLSGRAPRHRLFLSLIGDAKKVPSVGLAPSVDPSANGLSAFTHVVDFGFQLGHGNPAQDRLLADHPGGRAGEM